MKRMDARGMTLLEMLMVVIVLGILGALAISGYRRTLERGYCRVATDILITIYHGERAYYFTHANRYHGPLNKSSSHAAWGQIFMDNPHLNSIPVTWTVVSNANGTGFSATARRDSGPCSTQFLFIDDLGPIVTGGLKDNPDCCGAR